MLPVSGSLLVIETSAMAGDGSVSSAAVIVAVIVTIRPFGGQSTAGVSVTVAVGAVVSGRNRATTNGPRLVTRAHSGEPAGSIVRSTSESPSRWSRRSDARSAGSLTHGTLTQTMAS